MRNCPWRSCHNRLGCLIETNPKVGTFVAIVAVSSIGTWNILWVSITKPKDSVLQDTRRLPVLFDTGFNQNLLITPDHLWRWARLRPEQLQPLAKTKIYDTVVSLRNAEVWVHRNRC